MTAIAIEHWLEAMIESANELSTTVLCAGDVEVIGRNASSPPESGGAYVALVGEELLSLGLSSSEEGCGALARAFMGLEAADELSRADMVDALGEIANIIGGGVKRRMAETAPLMRLGLPLVVQGFVQAGGGTETRAAEVRLGSVMAYLLVIRTASDLTAPR